MKYYVSMIDTFLSDWGGSEGKKNVYVVECDTLPDAELILKNAKRRAEMKNPRIRTTYPVYPDASHVVDRRTFSQLGEVWKK